MATSTQVDEALAEHFDWLCYSQQAQPTADSQIFFGLLTIMPELRGDLPLAARSLKSWSKLAANNEGGPMAEEAIYAIFITMLQAGLIIEAIWVLTQYDAYAREQDIEGLRVADISFFDGFASLEFGVSQRGESAKFATNQGVIIRRGAVTDMLLALRSTAPPNGRIFPITQANFRMAWHRVCRQLGLAWAGPPHRLRHSGPSEDIARERASLESVRRRGRWKAMKSVQRYSKTSMLVKFRARMPLTTLSLGERVGNNIRRAAIQALQGQASTSTLASTVLDSLIMAAGKDARSDYSQIKVAKTSRSRKTAPTDDDSEYGSTDPGEDLWMTE